MFDNKQVVHHYENTDKNSLSPGEARAVGSIQLSGVGRSYPAVGGAFRALSGVELWVSPGELACVVGPSGSGKSTLLHLIAGLDVPTAGRITVSGVELQKLDENARSRFRGRNIGVVFQFFQLLPTLTVLENVCLAMELGGVFARAQHRARAAELLARFEVLDQQHKLPAALSGGQQQRVALARALANDPPIVLCDEPTGNLDSHSADLVFEHLKQLSLRGTTVLTVTHERHYQARFSRVIELLDGGVVRDEATPSGAAS